MYACMQYKNSTKPSQGHAYRLFVWDTTKIKTCTPVTVGSQLNLSILSKEDVGVFEYCRCKRVGVYVG